MIARPLRLGQLLRRTVISPRSVADLLNCHAAALEFRLIVEAIFPDEAAELWQTRQAGATREAARVVAFLRRVETQFFPLYDVEEYDQVVAGIPFVRLGWSYEAFHDVERRLGELLLLVLCQAPVHVRVPLLDWAATHIPPNVLAQVPEGGFPPDALHHRFDGTSCVAVAEFADWLWGETGNAFLNLDDEVAVTDAPWTRETVVDLAAQWQCAQALLDRIEALVAWLEADPATRFAQLVEAALGDDAQLTYQRSRRLYELEITARGLVVIPHDEPAALPLPGGAPTCSRH